MFTLNILKSVASKITYTRTVHTTLPTCGALKPPEKLYKLMGINPDRTQEIPVETSIRYIQSAAYKQTYGDTPIWTLYRRNFKGLFPPNKTRKTCIRGGQISTGNPCPICRDEYLIINEVNVELLKQFICPYTGKILDYKKTGLCQKTHLQLLTAISRARDLGLLTFDVPLRKYDYSEYYSEKIN